MFVKWCSVQGVNLDFTTCLFPFCTVSAFLFLPIFVSKHIAAIKSSRLAAPVDEAPHRWSSSTGLQVIDRRLIFWRGTRRKGHQWFESTQNTIQLLPIIASAVLLVFKSKE